MTTDSPTCAQCMIKIPVRRCMREDGKAPSNCPTECKPEVLAKTLKEYERPEIQEFARQASIQEGEGYGDKGLEGRPVRPIKPRIVETIEFAKRMGYERLGFVFCIGLQREAQAVEKILASKDFQVISVACKVGCAPKETIGVQDDQKIRPGSFESMCNPIMQANVLNEARTELNVLLGLCVGHDSLVLKYSDALCTVLAAKDRLLGHNPLAAIYNLESYYRYLK
ncbi:DUF1847 domain-containing protein [Thermodesulfobacteriota bacterium]